MNQVWNIFRKDVRHHWIEIMVSLLLAVGFAWAEINEWSQGRDMAVAFGPGAIFFGIARGLAVPLLPISWMFLIVRIVHGESLAGDRQFWVTRPYNWMSLLTAKVLFVITFVNVPLLLAQIFLLHQAGFHPTHYVAGLLWLQLFWTVVLLLPTAVLAAVTRNIGQMLLALLFVGLFVIGESYLSDVVRDSNFSGPGGSIEVPFVIVAMVAVILLQYSLRRTTQSRWILGGVAGLLMLSMVAAPYRTLIARQYPTARADFPMHLTLQAPPQEVHYYSRDRVPLPVNFSLSGLPENSFAELNGVILTLKNSAEQHWDSGWQYRRVMFFPEEKVVSPSLEVTEDVLGKLRSAPMSADLFLAFTLYRDTNHRQLVVPEGEFSFPGLGFCSTGSHSTSALMCRIALRRPPFLMVRSEMAASTCPLGKDQIAPTPGQIVRADIRGGSDPAEPGLSPIVMDRVAFWQASNSRMSGICPGTPLTVSNPEEAGRGSIEAHIDSAWFAAYLQAVDKDNHP